MNREYLLSSAIGQQRIPTFADRGRTGFGAAHYSWSIVAAMYRRGLAEIRRVAPIDAPDIYQHPIAMQTRGISAEAIHLASKPVELLRPLFGRTNVAIQLWEFAELSERAIEGEPRTNQVRMLKTMDAVWCASSFTQQSLAAYGINSFHLPPPVTYGREHRCEPIDQVAAVTLDSKLYAPSPMTTLGELGIGSGDRDIYLAVLAPFDKRKNLRALLDGFLASKAARTGTLLIKLILDNVVTSLPNINHILADDFELEATSPAVVFCGEYLSTPQMNSLYDLAAFFVSSSAAEGLNLPLIESMARGVPAISSSRTAMNDYVSEERAIVLKAKRQPTMGDIHALGPDLKTTFYPPTSAAITAAFDHAAELGTEQRKALGAKGATFVNTAFGLELFEQRVTAFEGTLA